MATSHVVDGKTDLLLQKTSLKRWLCLKKLSQSSFIHGPKAG